MNAPAFTRRRFTGGLGTLVIAFSLDPNLAFAQERLPGSLQNNRKLDGWVRINPDGTATIFTGKVELGQGILTALAQIAAEELDLPLARLKMISGDTRQTPNEGQTAGSQSIENSGTALRMACAEARAVLIEAAAQRIAPLSQPLVRRARPLSNLGPKRVARSGRACRDAVLRFTHRVIQIVDRDRLHQHGRKTHRFHFRLAEGGSKACDQDERNPRMLVRQNLSEFDAGHPRHHLVRDDCIKPAAVFAHEFQGLSSAGRTRDPILPVLQTCFQRFSNQQVIVNQQNVPGVTRAIGGID